VPLAEKEPLIALTGHTGPVLAVAFSRDGCWLLTGSADRTIRTWNVVTGQERALLRGHEGAVTALAFAPDGLQFASGSEDTTVLLWQFAKVIGHGK
jgi:WD40 repeat protein